MRCGDGWPLTGHAEAELLLFGDFPQATTPPRFGGPNGLPLTTMHLTPDDPRASRWPDEQVAVLVRPDGIVASISDQLGTLQEWETKLSAA